MLISCTHRNINNQKISILMRVDNNGTSETKTFYIDENNRITTKTKPIYKLCNVDNEGKNIQIGLYINGSAEKNKEYLKLDIKTMQYNRTTSTFIQTKSGNNLPTIRTIELTGQYLLKFGEETKITGSYNTITQDGQTKTDNITVYITPNEQ